MKTENAAAFLEASGKPYTYRAFYISSALATLCLGILPYFGVR